jgi:hypothetical protein
LERLQISVLAFIPKYRIQKWVWGTMMKEKKANFVPQYKEPPYLGFSLHTIWVVDNWVVGKCRTRSFRCTCFTCPNATEMEFLFYVMYTVVNVTLSCFYLALREFI